MGQRDLERPSQAVRANGTLINYSAAVGLDGLLLLVGDARVLGRDGPDCCCVPRAAKASYEHGGVSGCRYWRCVRGAAADCAVAALDFLSSTYASAASNGPEQ